MATVHLSETVKSKKTNKTRHRRNAKQTSGKKPGVGGSDRSDRVTITSTISPAVKKRAETAKATPIEKIIEIKDDAIVKRPVKLFKGNDFSTAVVLPHKAKVLGIPDEFAGETAPFRAMINAIIPPIGAGQTTTQFRNYSYLGRNNFPPGKIIMKTRRAWYHPYQYIKEGILTSPAGANPLPQTGLVKKQSPCGGIFNKRGLNTVGDGESLVLPYNQLNNVVVPLVMQTSTAMENTCYPFKNKDQNGDIFYGHSKSVRASQDLASHGSIVFQYFVATPIPNTIDNGVTVTLVDCSGPVATKTVRLTPGLTIVTFAAGDLPNFGDMLGDRMFGVRMQTNANTNVVGDLTLDFVALTVNYDPNFSFLTLDWSPVNFNDVDGAANTFETYRVVGICNWFKYIGGTGFNDAGGLVCGVNTYGGEPITYAGTDNGSFLWQDAGIRSTEYSDTEAIEHGIYGFIPFRDTKSFQFHTMGSNEPDIDCQGMIIASINASTFNGAMPVNLFTLQGCVIYEPTTTVAYIHAGKSRVKPSEIVQTERLITQHMSSHYMSNFSHEEALQWALLPAQAIAGSVASLGPAVQTILPLLGMGKMMI